MPRKPTKALPSSRLSPFLRYKNRGIYKILDANFNRAKEGLRVCEDIARFFLKDAMLAVALRKTRHSVTSALTKTDLLPEMVYERNTRNDPGKDFNGTMQSSCKALFLSNMQRVKEALRVLEELLKLIDMNSSRSMQRIRFKAYDIEKKAVEKFPSLFDPR